MGQYNFESNIPSLSLVVRLRDHVISFRDTTFSGGLKGGYIYFNPPALKWKGVRKGKERTTR